MEDGVQCQQGAVTGQSTGTREGRTGCQLQVGVVTHQQPLAVTGKTERALTSGSIQGLGLCFALFCYWPGPVHGREGNVMGGRRGEGSVLEEEPGVWAWRCPVLEVSEQDRWGASSRRSCPTPVGSARPIPTTPVVYCLPVCSRDPS